MITSRLMKQITLRLPQADWDYYRPIVQSQVPLQLTDNQIIRYLMQLGAEAAKTTKPRKVKP